MIKKKKDHVNLLTWEVLRSARSAAIYMDNFKATRETPQFSEILSPQYLRHIKN